MQGMYFAAGPFSICDIAELGSQGVQAQKFPVFLHDKGGSEDPHSRPVHIFLYRLSRSFFLGIMGLLSAFFLLHPPFFEVEAQRQEEQLHPDILLSGC